MMRCDVLTLFPGIIEPVLGQSILKRAQENGFLSVRVYNLRDFTADKHKTVDDHPFGGGAGMVLKPEPIFEAVEKLLSQGEPLRLILTTPQGRPFTHREALDFSREERRLVFICGRYEGIDERVRECLRPEEFSIGDYVLTGGELAALVMMDASVRLIPGALGDPCSAQEDSFSVSDGLLDYPHFTRPADFRGMRVPEVLLSGNHEAIRKWRRQEALYQTWKKRPDLFRKLELSDEDQRLLEEAKARKNNNVGRGMKKPTIEGVGS
jgi:tRNA (guanine37-N1)-methyltransferase